MGLFEDFSNFLEARLDDFLKSNPELNLTILSQEVKQEKKDTIQFISVLESKQKTLENQIIALGNDITNWHDRIEKAKQAGRFDLAQEAEKKQASLLQEGNILWHQMETVKQKNSENKKKLISLEEKEREINLKKEQLRATKEDDWHQQRSYQTRSKPLDDLEAKFQQWEIEQELQSMKKNS